VQSERLGLERFILQAYGQGRDDQVARAQGKQRETIHRLAGNAAAADAQVGAAALREHLKIAGLMQGRQIDVSRIAVNSDGQGDDAVGGHRIAVQCGPDRGCVAERRDQERDEEYA